MRQPLTEAAAKLLHDIQILYRALQCAKRDSQTYLTLVQQIHTKSLAFVQITGQLVIAEVEARGGERQGQRDGRSAARSKHAVQATRKRRS